MISLGVLVYQWWTFLKNMEWTNMSTFCIQKTDLKLVNIHFRKLSLSIIFILRIIMLFYLSIYAEYNLHKYCMSKSDSNRPEMHLGYSNFFTKSVF